MSVKTSMWVQAIAILFLCILRPILCYEEMDKGNDPILEHLKMDRNNVLRYKPVEINLPKRLHKRDLEGGTKLQFQSFEAEEYINLWLLPADTIFASDETPVWLEQSKPSDGYRVNYVREYDAMKNVGKLMEDRNHMASLVIGSDNFGRTTVNGVLRSRRDNKRLVIRSLPENVVDEYSRGRRSIVELSSDDTNLSNHFLFELPDDDTKNYDIRDHNGRQTGFYSNLQNLEKSSASNWNRKNADIIYPRILVQVDSSYPKLTSSEDLTHFLAYLSAFWNSINMIYGKIDYPKFRLNIAGFVIAENPEATPFIMDHMMKKDVFDADSAIEDLRRIYFENEMQFTFPTYTYDILVTMSMYKMASVRSQYIVGVAQPENICESQIDRISGALIIHDDGGSFRTALNAAHELGHVFGLAHDDESSDPDCAAYHGYLMSSGVSNTENAAAFSKCSLDSLAKFYEDGNFACMKNVPEHTGNRLLIPLPGETKSLDEQCAALGFARLCDWGDRDVCDSLPCMYESGSCSSTPGVGAAPGSPCGGKDNPRSKICVNKRCVHA